jgi:hypothetical protein
MLNYTNTKLLQIMIFYSLLSFFIAPYALSYYIKDPTDSITHGMIIGSIISVFLWIKFGKTIAFS